MSGIRSTTGLISGIDIGALVDALVEAERAPARRLETRLKNTQATQTSLGQLQAQLITLTSNAQTLANRRTFNTLTVQNSAPEQLTVTTKNASLPGTYQFQTVRTSSSQRSLSRGFANAESQQVGAAGQLVLTREGSLNRSAKLELLNNAQGVRRGQIRLTDRSGATADVDLRNAVTIGDVVTSINQSGLGIRAESLGGRLVLNDTTGSTTSNLTVAEIGGGKTATDLGILQSVAGNTLTGGEVYQVTGDFTFGLLNDGNTLKNVSGQPELAVNLKDGTSFNVDLDGAATVGDVLKKFNDHASNGGKLVASLSNNRLVLTDTTSGGGTFSVANLNGGNAKNVFGIDKNAVGGVITGDRLTAGADSVLLRNLRGGRGITTRGEVSLTDRTGTTATIDLTNAESLDEVLSAINGATSSGSVKLQLTARKNATGTGIEVVDTSGSTASSLVIADVGGGTVAADLGIAVNAATTSVGSGALRLRTVNEATSLANYNPRGGQVATGSFRITDSDGNQAVVNITASQRTVGDVIERINAATGIQVTARLNDTGDGIVIIDNAAGAGTLAVAEAGGRTAADLRLLGTGVVGGSGSQEVSGRRAQVVEVAATDTLAGVMSKINLVGGTIRASVSNTGSSVNGFRLSVASTISGAAGGFTIEEGNLGLNFGVQEQARDAILRVGSDAATGFLVSSSSNTFTNVVSNLDVTVNQVGSTAANVVVTQDRSTVTKGLQDFVTAYNSYIDLSTALTQYDTATQRRAALQGTTAPLAVQDRLRSLVNAVSGSPSNTVRSLADVGIKLAAGGKLAFDAEKLNAALDAAPDQVSGLFTDTTNGFGTKLEKAIDGFTDEFNGSLTLQFNSLQSNVESLTAQIEGIDARLAVRRQRLELQFANLEATLSGLQSQSSSLSNLANILSNLKASNGS